MKIAGKYPSTRLRRVRNSKWIRRLISENNLSTNDLILPIFVTEGKNKKEKIKSMPGVYRYSVDMLNQVMRDVKKYKIPMVALFPYINNNKKCSFEDLGCKCIHETSRTCSLEEKCIYEMCQFSH